MTKYLDEIVLGLIEMDIPFKFNKNDKYDIYKVFFMYNNNIIIHIYRNQIHNHKVVLINNVEVGKVSEEVIEK